jgi:hypothetical protein
MKDEDRRSGGRNEDQAQASRRAGLLAQYSMTCYQSDGDKKQLTKRCATTRLGLCVVYAPLVPGGFEPCIKKNAFSGRYQLVGLAKQLGSCTVLTNLRKLYALSCQSCILALVVRDRQ